LLSGATLFLARRDELYSAANVMQILRELSITAVTLPPALLATMPDDELPTLDTLVSAGEMCSTNIVNRWSQGRHFINAYGPTETTVCATLVECAGNYSAPPPVGRPIDNTQVYLLDANQNPVPLGASGEMYVGGVGLARGYLLRPDLTAEKFVPHPFSSEPGARLYRTGDLGRYFPDGNVEFFGRRDHQVKIRGYRIELGEIENALKLSPAVENAVVIEREDRLDGQSLVAYVVLKPEQSATTGELRGFSKRVCLNTCYRPLSSCSPNFRSRRAERLIGRDCPLPSKDDSVENATLCRHARQPSRCWPTSGPKSCKLRGSESTRTSSSSADTRYSSGRLFPVCSTPST